MCSTDFFLNVSVYYFVLTCRMVHLDLYLPNWFSCLGTKSFSIFFSFLLNYFLCRDRWNGDVTPTLDVALLCSSRAGSDLGRESGLV